MLLQGDAQIQKKAENEEPVYYAYDDSEGKVDLTAPWESLEL